MKHFINQDVIDEKAAEIFPEDGDVQEILSSWFRGHYSDTELLEKLKYAKTFQFDRAAEQMADDCDDEHATFTGVA